MSEKRYLVTGSSSGIGLAVTERLLDRGDRVLGIARRAASVPELAERDGYEALALDLAALDGLLATLDPALRSFSGENLDGAILCAGAGLFKGLEQCSDEEIRAQLDLNLTSQILVARAAVPLLKARRAGDIILLGSESALRGRRRGALYCAAKFGLRGFAQALREECSGAGVRVSLVNPGSVRTPFFDELDFTAGEADDEALEAADVAAAILHILDAPSRVVFDEIDIAPRKRVVRFRSGKRRGADGK